MKNLNKLHFGLLIFSWWDRLFLIVLCLVFLLAKTYGQKQASHNPSLALIAQPNSEPGWINFRQDLEIKAESLFETYPEAFGLKADDKMKLVRVKTDKLGYTHHKFKQYFKGIKVDGGDYIVHENQEGKASSANGMIVTELNISTTPLIKESKALQVIKNNVDFSLGSWHNTAEEDRIKELNNDPNATNFPEGELIIYRKDKSKTFDSKNMILAWQFDVFLDPPGTSQRLFVDANTGTLLNSYPLDHNCNVGTVETPWYGQQTIWTDFDFGDNEYQLLDDCYGSHDYHLRTRIWNFPIPGLWSPVSSDDNNWADNYLEIAGGTTHWGIHEARDYFHFVHDRDSWDDNGGNIEAVIDPAFGGAQWRRNGRRMRFGLSNDTNPNNDWYRIDIVGHEFAHAVANASVGSSLDETLTYQGESGALNESFADIFGVLVELYASGNLNWSISKVGRKLDNPNASNQPDTYKATGEEGFWYTGGDDNGGVHTNSGVQNYWFYLLSEGGSGENFFGTNYDVTGIGIESAAEIAYLTLVYYMNPNDDYLDARSASLQAATQRFGSCSFEAQQVAEAWHAVGVGTSIPQYNYEICGTITSGSYQGIYTIEAGGSCTTTANAHTSSIWFSAGDEVILKSGFTATAGSFNDFIAYTYPCFITLDEIMPYTSNNSHTHHEADNLEDMRRENEGTLSESVEEKNGSMLIASPNPFSSTTSIEYQISSTSSVHLAIYDFNGRILETLIQMDQQEEGTYQVPFDASHLPAGFYFARLITNTGSKTSKLLLE